MLYDLLLMFLYRNYVTPSLYHVFATVSVEANKQLIWRKVLNLASNKQHPSLCDKEAGHNLIWKTTYINIRDIAGVQRSTCSMYLVKVIVMYVFICVFMCCHLEVIYAQSNTCGQYYFQRKHPTETICSLIATSTLVDHWRRFAHPHQILIENVTNKPLAKVN